MPARADALMVHFDRVLPVPPERVFRACTDPIEWALWWGPRGFTNEVECELRVGGCYRITMQPPDAEVFHLTGEFREVEPPHHLAYTFVWEEPDPDDQDNLVTMSFRDAGEATGLVVEHGPFTAQPRRALHEAGWTDGLAKLAEMVSIA